MLRALIRLLVLSFAIPSFAIAAPHDSLPGKYWQYMDGYKYEYSGNCLVSWDVKSAVFIVPDACSVALYDRLNSDAIKSIEYMRSKSSAKNFYEYYQGLEPKPTPQPVRVYSREAAKTDAKDLWRQACLDAKELRPADSNELIDRYPGIKIIHALRLLQNARQTVSGLGGMVNCAEQGHYVVEMYASDIDIRAKNK